MLEHLIKPRMVIEDFPQEVEDKGFIAEGVEVMDMEDTPKVIKMRKKRNL